MFNIDLFTPTQLTNRLGQTINLPVYWVNHMGRDMVFVVTPSNALNFLTKNAETLAFQLREMFSLDAKYFDFIEIKDQAGECVFVRWRFDWVGASPRLCASEPLQSASQRNTMLSLTCGAAVIEKARA
jgi:hypothetical protein